MNIVEFVSYLQNLGVKLWIDKDQLGYRSPKGVMTGELKRNLVERKTEVLEFLREVQTTQESGASFIIRPVSRSGDLLLSYPQEWMFFWDQFLPENPLYNVPMILQFEGLLNVTVLEQSLNEIIRRHENLRTSFPSIDGKPIQVISTVANINLSTVELPSSPEKTTQLTQLARTEAEKPFDLAQGPLLRVTLVKLKPEIHILMLTMHHIICDVWSLGLLASELCTLYEAYSQGNPSPLSELPIQYADYAHWQRQQLTAEVLEKHLNYWRQKLAGISPILPLPTDRPRPEVQSFQGEAKKFQLNQNLTQKLTQLGQELGTTLFITLLSAFFILLYRYSGESDLIVGSATANRNRAETEPLIGMLANILAIRSQCSDDSSFTELLIQVKQTAQEAYKYQDLPFEKLVGELLPERNLSYNPIVQVMLDFLNVKGGVKKSWDLPGLRVTQDGNSMSNVRMDLEIYLWKAPSGSGLEGYFVYNTDLFDRATITRMMENFQTLLKAIVANPQEKISKLPLISATEQQKLLEEWKKTKTDYPRDKCIHQLFEKVVEKNPEAIALIFEEQQLTYTQLNHKANQLAYHLLSLGITPETPIGIYIDPTPERIIGLLAILKAGGAYIPLDSNNLQDLPSISVILTQKHLKSKIPDPNAKILCLDTEWESIAKQNTENPNTETTATNLAYILNQTLVEHQAIAQRLQWLQETLSITNQDILLHKASLTKEVALLEIGLPLISGSSIVIAANENPTELQKLIAQHKITIIHLYPSELPTWLNTTNPETSLKSWQTLLSSGETLSTELADKFLQSYPVSLHNFYSIPEAAGEITHWSWSEKPNRENVPIGNPGRLSVYLLDQHKNPVPKGVPGEIYIGGSSLARDALEPQKSQEFIKHPQLGRLFQTGEIGREHNKGYLEIVGAKQRQTWIKGKRIELANIETALLSAPQVEQAYVLAHQTFLVAYVVMAGVWNPQQLHSQIQQQLPPDMMPGAYVPMSSLPLTYKGKVDEVALGRFPVIDDNVVQQWEAKLKAVPEIEQVAVVVQQKTLKLPPLHISDLLPSEQMKLPNHGATPVVEKSSPTTELQTQSTSRNPAISEGEPIKWPKDAPTTLAQALERAAQEHGDTSLIYIHSDGEVITQTYSELWVEAQRLLGGLRQLGLKPQDKVIFQLESNQDFISAFWGCVLGGFVPVPVSIPPSYDQSHSSLTKLQNTWALLGQPLVLTDRKLAPSVSGWFQRMNLGKLELQTIEKLRSSEVDRNWYNSQPEDVAILLLTSGSTGMPKAVMQSHSSLLSRSAATAQINNFSSEEISLNWFPLDHVGGIVMFHIRDVYLGCQQIHVPTQEILQAPTRWLDLMSQYRTTITWAPNFAYELVNQRLEELDYSDRPSTKSMWDLSSLEFVLNGGEAVVAKTARKFVKLLSKWKLPKTAMHPAWGMSETASGVAYSHQFTLDSTDDGQKFVEVGSPIPGFAIRIVDNQNQIVSEETIGRVQVKGASVTSGYYQNPTANQEAFTADGWFNTGDLGFLKNGRLTITGRQKDVIIINGLNYYSHEIESAVEELPQIEVSYTAACALRETNSNTDKLGIFFNSEKTEDTELLVLLKTLREQVVNRMGINPDYLIPLDKELIPKTSIGKIQRSQLSQRFATGEFQEILKGIDLITENNNTIPDWFYQKTWRRKQGNYQTHKLAKIGVILVFLDELGLGKKLCQLLENNSQAYVQIELGETFKKINKNHYVIAPDVREDYQQLYQSLGAEYQKIGAMIHLWHYDKYPGEIADTETLETAQKTGIYSLLLLLQTFGNQKGNYPVRLLYVASQSQSLEPKELIAYEKATVPGLLKTIPQENPHWYCRHLDIPQESLEVNSNRILEELTIDAKDSEVAYRDGERWVSGIKKINLPSLPLQPLPFKTGGIYLISGGLGGIGVEIAKYLLEHYQAKLLLLGRTPLPDSNSWETYLQQGGKLAEKIKIYQQLQKLGGEVIYQGVDIGNLTAVQEVVQQTLSGWHAQQLDGVIHLAGSYHESPLKEETKQSCQTLLYPKVQGAWVLHQLVQKQPSTLFINFSSAAGVFGGATVGAYASSNSFLENLTHYQRYQRGLNSYCFAWTTWSETGMSKGYQMKYLTRSQGYSNLSVSQGMSSMLAGLCRNQAYLMVGLDGSNLNIRRLTSTSDILQQLTAYFTTNGKGKPNVSFLQPQVQDAVGQPSSCAVVELAQMPLTETGEIDIGLLRESNLGRSTQERIKPRNETEHEIAQIWQDLLGVSQVGIYDNFFELGGNSLLATQVISRLRQAFEMELTLQDLFEYPTVAGITQNLEVLRQLAQDENTFIFETGEDYKEQVL
ncbi:MAG: SDR family NAD(P)-dependent oxidoreductase [Okeania sp. SIO2C9]|uniref:SDR family NAD(P)-dependent oxidoreductase n=1 Tax=Okeania sp. SIO2C9 TaxID=2607791 RepID=UPI0013BFFE9B|nr:SDR family NAD(P)-dependent oxidoreductase [Okeania sp. SIO2C9]NEQ77462.1 SDR family NAD(P)-dependent oxidoreductase [Okeania sp. SIO2C9]